MGPPAGGAGYGMPSGPQHRRVRSGVQAYRPPPVGGFRAGGFPGGGLMGGGLPSGGPPGGRSGRAGRNLPAALMVGLGLGALVLTTLFLYRPAFVLLVIVSIAISTWELVIAASKVEARPPLVPLLVGTVLMDGLAWLRGAQALGIAFLLTGLAIMVWRLVDGPAGYLRDTATGVLIALYGPFLAGFGILLAQPADGAKRVLAYLAVVVCNDTAGYAAGVFFGKHPLAPTVSPKKSVEGFVGSVLACVGFGVGYFLLVFHHGWWQGAVFGVALAVTATVGDLGESMIKRDLGIKDMGTLLPGHGGLMDRLDSLLPSAAVAYLLLATFIPLT